MMLLAVCAIVNLIAQNYNHPLHIGVVVIMKRKSAIIVKAFRRNYHSNAAIVCSPKVAGAVSLTQPVSSSYRWHVIFVAQFCYGRAPSTVFPPSFVTVYFTLNLH